MLSHGSLSRVFLLLALAHSARAYGQTGAEPFLIFLFVMLGLLGLYLLFIIGIFVWAVIADVRDWWARRRRNRRRIRDQQLPPPVVAGPPPYWSPPPEPSPVAVEPPARPLRVYEMFRSHPNDRSRADNTALMVTTMAVATMGAATMV